MSDHHSSVMMPERNSPYLALIAELTKLEPPLFLFGGFAEDALLHGEVSRPHDDVDVFTWLDDLDLRLGQVRALGFRDMRIKFEPAPGRPLVLGATSEGAELELVVGQRTSQGRGFFEIPGPRGLRRMLLPADATSYPEQTLGQVEVRVLSPRTLYQVRIVSAEMFGGFRPKDVLMQDALKSRFFPDSPVAALQPAYEELGV